MLGIFMGGKTLHIFSTIHIQEATSVEAIAITVYRLEAIASRMEAIAILVEAIAGRMEAIATSNKKLLHSGVLVWSH